MVMLEDKMIDVYAYGIVLFEILNRGRSWKGVSPKDVMADVQNGIIEYSAVIINLMCFLGMKTAFDSPEKILQIFGDQFVLFNLISDCLNTKATLRPDFPKICEILKEKISH